MFKRPDPIMILIFMVFLVIPVSLFALITELEIRADADNGGKIGCQSCLAGAMAIWKVTTGDKGKSTDTAIQTLAQELHKQAFCEE